MPQMKKNSSLYNGFASIELDPLSSKVEATWKLHGWLLRLPLSIQSPSGNTMAELVALIYGERKRHVKQQHLGDESLDADSQS